MQRHFVVVEDSLLERRGAFVQSMATGEWFYCLLTSLSVATQAYRAKLGLRYAEWHHICNVSAQVADEPLDLNAMTATYPTVGICDVIIVLLSSYRPLSSHQMSRRRKCNHCRCLQLTFLILTASLLLKLLP
jgi:hypothetical protein